MRQDPDAMLIGEIRDEETASIAIRASITGHLVLSTVHTNDAVTAIPRLLDLGVDRFLLSSALLAVIAQRLVRKVCSRCAEPYEYAPGELEKMGFTGIDEKSIKARRGKGCAACNQTGYLGRTSIGEILIIDDEIRELVYSGGSVNVIKEKAMKGGMKTMRENGIQKASAGLTTFEEVLRVVG
jgi:type II secretory ATPase GspE/PulE/Tfp pilus assembly ATPase PilB-like protein